VLTRCWLSCAMDDTHLRGPPGPGAPRAAAEHIALVLSSGAVTLRKAEKDMVPKRCGDSGLSDQSVQ